jgi:glycosyltransferase involved in cell wall biosynthesis
MDILFVGHLAPHNAGTGIVNAGLVRGLGSRGHRVTALSPTPLLDAPEADAAETLGAGTRILRYPVPHARPEWARSTPHYDAAERATLTQLLAPFRADPPDVLLVGHESLVRHLPTPAAPFVPSALMLHSGVTPPLLDSAGDEFAWLRDGVRRFDRVVAVAASLARSVAALGIPCRVIGNGVELDRFLPRPRDPALAARLGIGAGDVVVLHPSNLKPIKRPLDLVAAARLAVPRAPALRVVVAGDGMLREDMAAAVAAAGLTDRFRFAGWVPHAAMPEMYALADIVAMPSAGEGMALAYLETLASGRVLVASDIAASRDLVRHGASALMHPVGDVPALADRLVTAALDPRLRARIGAAARVVAERHDIERTIDAYAAMLGGLAGGRLRRGAGSLSPRK